jgi:hypothetical protein
VKLPAWGKPVAVSVSVVAVLWGMYYYMYAGPLGRVQKELSGVVASNNDLNNAIKDHGRVRTALKEFAAGTIASTGDSADARFRSLLSEMAVSSGLSKGSVQISTDHVERVLNPGGTSKLATRLKDDLKKQVDFRVIKGELTGTGPLEAALRTMATVKAQPWVHRIESFSIKPEDRDRQKFTLRMSVSTLIVPELAPADLPEPAIVPVADGGRGLWAGIAQKNVFKEPAPLVVASNPTPEPAAPARPPWADWKLTGLVESRLGTEVFLVNTKNGQRMNLAVGSAVSEAKFVGGTGEKAVFEIGGEKFEVFNGQTLEQRRPTDR